jgi:hypothetical protein
MRLDRVDDRMIDDCGAVSGMRFRKGIKIHEGNLFQYSIFHHMT